MSRDSATDQLERQKRRSGVSSEEEEEEEILQTIFSSLTN